MTKRDTQTDIDPRIIDAMKNLPADFSGFPKLFQERLQPELRAREVDRVKAAKQARFWSWVGAAIAVLGIVFGLIAFRVPQLTIVAFVIGFAVHGAGRSPINNIRREAKSLLVTPIADEFSLEFQPEPGPQSIVDRVHRAGLVPSWDRADFEDRLEGERNGVKFQFFEANLEQRRTVVDGKGRTQTRWVTVFSGQCLRFQFHKAFAGQTLVLRDAGVMNRFSGKRGLQRVKLESAGFEKAFEVHSNDQVEARFLLTPDLMQRLLELEKVFKGSGLRCAFQEGDMLIALEGGDLFEPGSMFTPLDNPERIRELLDDFAAIFNLIDSFADPEDLLRLTRANDED